MAQTHNDEDALAKSVEDFRKLKEVLESWPLYRKCSYQGGKAFVLPSVVRLFCSQCGGERNWEAPLVVRGSGAPPPLVPVGSRHAPPPTLSGYDQSTYTCRDCKSQSVTYFYFYSWRMGADSFLVKVGQHPALEHHPPAELSRNLDKDDAELYKKALTSRNFAFGIGALAYLRRIVENKMNDLLDLIEQAAKLDGEVPDELRKIDEVKRSWRFDDKIAYAAKALPAHLRKGGVNPLDFLHDLASEGLHYKTEGECIDVFDRCKNAFEYVFRQLRVEIHDATAYIATVKPQH